MNCVLDYLTSEVSISDRPAIIFYSGKKSLNNPELRCNFNELTELAKKAGAYLEEEGIKRGDKVILFERRLRALWLYYRRSCSRSEVDDHWPWMLVLILILLLKRNPKRFYPVFWEEVFIRSKQVSKIPVRLTIKKMLEALQKNLSLPTLKWMTRPF